MTAVTLLQLEIYWFPTISTLFSISSSYLFLTASYVASLFNPLLPLWSKFLARYIIFQLIFVIIISFLHSFVHNLSLLSIFFFLDNFTNPFVIFSLHVLLSLSIFSSNNFCFYSMIQAFTVWPCSFQVFIIQDFVNFVDNEQWFYWVLQVHFSHSQLSNKLEHVSI